MKSPPVLSLCMIVKDEEESLPLCLKSIAGVVDQIVVVDTGSSDKTMDVARSFGAETYAFPWNDSFSEARNYSLKQARGDWVLILDGDDELVWEDKQPLQELLSSKEAEAYFMQTLNMLGNDRPETELRFPTLRLFRNRPVYRYTGRIHESIIDSIVNHAGKESIRFSQVRVRHFGYLKKKVKEKSKATRNLLLLQKEIVERGEDSFLLYNVGVEYLRLGNADKALVSFTRAETGLSPHTSFAPSLVRKKIDCLVHMGHKNEALVYLDSKIKSYPDYTDLYYLQGLLYFAKENILSAIAAFKQCLRLGVAPSHYLSETGISDYLPSYALGSLYEMILETDKALGFYHQALTYNPSDFHALHKLVWLLLSTRGCKDVTAYVDTHLNLCNITANLLVASLFMKKCLYQEAAPYLEKAVSLGAQDESICLLGECLLLCGDMNAAEEKLRQLQITSPHYMRAQQNLCCLYWLRQNYQKAAVLLTAWPDNALRQVYEACNRHLAGYGQEQGPPETVLATKKAILGMVQVFLSQKRHNTVKDILSLLPISPEMESELGKLFFRHHVDTEAVTWLERALQKGQCDSEAVEMLMELYCKKGDCKRAEQIFLQAVSGKLTNIKIFEQGANLYREQAEALLKDLPGEDATLSCLTSMGKPRLSLCMIVRDEEKSLPTCLASVQQVVDEIIVVDTGSLDRSPEIAKSFGALVFHYPWQGDFAAARNFSLQQAKGDWILILDADEELHAGDSLKVKMLLDSQAEGYCFQLINYYGEQPGFDYMRDVACRLFRNRPEYRFSRSLHEQVIDEIFALEGVDSVKVANVSIHHYGYLTSTVLQKKKADRNLEIIRHEREKNPQNKFLCYSLAVELLNRGQFEEALALFTEAYTPGTSFASDVVLKKITCLRQLNQTDEALMVIRESLKHYPHFTDLMYMSGEIYLVRKEYSQAVASFISCLSLGEAPISYCSTNGVGSFRAHYLLGKAFELQGDRKQALHHYKKAIEVGPGFYPPLYALVGCLRREHKPYQVLRLLQQNFTFSGPSSLLLLADIFMNTDDFTLALECISRCVTEEKLIVAKQMYMKGLCLVQMGQDQGADAAWESVPAGNSYSLSALSWQFILALDKENKDRLETILATISVTDKRLAKTYQKIYRHFFEVADVAWKKDETQVVKEFLQRCKIAGKKQLMESLSVLGEM